MSPELLQLVDPNHALLPQSGCEMFLASKYSKQGDHQRAMAIYETFLKEQQNISGPNQTELLSKAQRTRARTSILREYYQHASITTTPLFSH